MSLTIKRYRPAFVIGYDDEVRSIASPDDILKQDYVQEIKQIYDKDKNFFRFTIDPYQNGFYLLLEINSGKEWHVIAMIGGDASDLQAVRERFPRFDPPPIADRLPVQSSGGFYGTPMMHPEYQALATAAGDITTIKMPKDGQAGIVRVVEEAFNGNLTALRNHALTLFSDECAYQASAALQQIDMRDLIVRQKLRKHSAELSLLNNYFVLKGMPDWDLLDPEFVPGMRMRPRLSSPQDIPEGSGTTELLVIRPFRMSEAVKEAIATHALYPTDDNRGTGWNSLSLWKRYVLVVDNLEATGYVVKAVPALQVTITDFLHAV